NKWDMLKLRHFCKSKDIINKTKWRPQKWKNIFINPIFDRGLNAKMYKELKTLFTKTPKIQFKSGMLLQ
ncbi:hypothetical protein ACQP3F_32205, partial [Escherichia coli]